jgi:RNA polymerase sigma-70 factor, ECF subfamily
MGSIGASRDMGQIERVKTRVLGQVPATPGTLAPCPGFCADPDLDDADDGAAPAVRLGSARQPLTMDLRSAERLRLALTQHHGLVWRSLRRFGVPEDLVDDAAQHLFLTFARRSGEITPARDRSFLLAAAVRVAANVRRLRARCPEIPSDTVDATSALDPEQLLDWKQRRHRLDRMLESLPLEQRSVFVLFELEGFSLPEIAESLDIPLGTATSRLRRARHRFEARVSLEPQEDP